MKVLITGIDGYSGWPLALHLISRGHEVVGIDNFVTRKRVKEVGSWSATPIPPFAEAPGGGEADLREGPGFYRGTCRNTSSSQVVLEQERPDAVVHLAEQRSGPVLDDRRPPRRPRPRWRTSPGRCTSSTP
jgi:UDP-sulfoquinovose synthase